MRTRTAVKTATILSLAAVLSLAPALPTEGAPTGLKPQAGQFSKKDFQFVKAAARGGMMEVELGKIAQQKGGIPAVQDFGKRMVTDHGQANAELKQLAASKGAILPSILSRKERRQMQHLEGLSPVKFDHAYARDMVRDHKHDIKAFEKAAKNVQDPELRAFVVKTIPILQKHLRLAQMMQATVSSAAWNSAGK
jgi:putative membrane protein